jgi:hypothetical protein
MAQARIPDVPASMPIYIGGEFAEMLKATIPDQASLFYSIPGANR